MNLTVIRFSSRADDTLGLLMVDGIFAAFTLEDEVRDTKVHGETCIPEGTYRLKLRTEGSMHPKYLSRFTDIHKGMLWLQDVRGFEWVYIHCGNDDDDTDACILVGDDASQNITKNGFIGASSSAYRRIYPVVAGAILNGEDVTITVTTT